MSVLVARGLHKTYVDATRRIEVLRNVDLDVEAGELVAVVGPSGSGKSTLLHCLGGLDRPDAGTVEVDGLDLGRSTSAELAAFRNRSLGFVFQFHQLLADFTALENVMIPGRIAGLHWRETRRLATTLLAEVGLGERLGHFPAELSGGERQRVALARALVLSPRLVLADEPTGNLDPDTGSQVFDLLLDLAQRRGAAVVVVTHNRELAKRSARLLLLAGGHLESAAQPAV
jgi:lipoprotein-releasing system ATP-binding protein